MFSIYGETGRIFKGAMEDLWHVEAVRRTSGVRRIGPTGMRPLAQAGAVTQSHLTATPSGYPQPLEAYISAGKTQAPRHPLIQVQEVMNSPVVVVRSDATVQAAWELLASHGIGQAPVVDGQGVLAGQLSRAELLSLDRLPHADANAMAWRVLQMQPVSSLMWTPVPAVAAETDIRQVARVLLQTHLPGLPVTDEEGQVIGFVSRTDILRAVVNNPPLDLWS